MSHQETEKNSDSNESIAVTPEGNLNPAEVINDAGGETDSSEVERLPVESIGSYARIEELVSDEEKENTSASVNES